MKRSSSTEFARAAGLGAARTGTGDFWRQRLTAMLGVPLTIAAIVIALGCLGRSHAEVLSWLGHPFTATVLLLAVLNTVLHMWIGMQVVIEDYVHNGTAKVLLLAANSAYCVAVGIAAVLAILKIQAGG